MSPRKVRRARRALADEVRREGRCTGLALRHRWLSDGYFWHRCARCGHVS